MKLSSDENPTPFYKNRFILAGTLLFLWAWGPKELQARTATNENDSQRLQNCVAVDWYPDHDTIQELPILIRQLTADLSRFNLIPEGTMDELIGPQDSISTSDPSVAVKSLLSLTDEPNPANSSQTSKNSSPISITFFKNSHWRAMETSANTTVTERYNKEALGCRSDDEFGDPITTSDDYNILVDRQGEAHEACPLKIFYTNDGHFNYMITQYLIDQRHILEATDGTEGHGNHWLETAYSRTNRIMKAYEERLTGADDPWDELNRIVDELRKFIQADKLLVSLPVLSVSAIIDLSPDSSPEVASNLRDFADSEYGDFRVCITENLD